MYDPSEIACQITDYLNDTICPPVTLQPDTNLLEIGAVDSLMIIDLVSHLQSAYGIHFESGEIIPINFRSADKLSELVHAKLQQRVTSLS